LGSAGPDAGPRETIARVERDPEIGCVVSGGGAAYHFLATHKSESGGAGVSDAGSADNEFIEDEIQSKVGRESSLDVVLKKAREIGRGERRRIVGARLGPRPRVREHALVHSPWGFTGEFPAK